MRKLLCLIFHRKHWDEFRGMGWVRKCLYPNGVYSPECYWFKKHLVHGICLKCGREFSRLTFITEEEKIRSWALNHCLKHGQLREDVMIEEMIDATQPHKL